MKKNPPKKRSSSKAKTKNGSGPGMHYLVTPILNKGTAFTEAERTRLKLHGLLPAHVQSLEHQLARTYQAFKHKADDLERHIYLRGLQDRNEVLYYRLLLEHIEEMLPVVYTPVVAQGCANFSRIYRRPRGLFISYPKRNMIRQILRNRPQKEIDVIVVTDGERVLGIGDQGVGGLGISIGKLSLYSLIGGIHPARTLPIVLDVGTNNPEHLRNPEYLGWPHERISGEKYYRFVEQFVRAVQQELPHACLQWEDFAGTHARPLLERYRDRLCTFNDDIQGTAAVALAALLSAVKAAGSTLKEQRIVFLGAGAAVVGVGDMVRMAMRAEGLSDEQARERIWMVDRSGLLLKSRQHFKPEQLPYARQYSVNTGSAGHMELKNVLEEAKATVLIGLSTVKGAFTEDVVQAMSRFSKRPIIFPLSNPTEKSEADPVDIMRWTDGRALIATGSPFPAVQWNGNTLPVSQCNNVYIFPAVGLAHATFGLRRVTDTMLMTAAHALAEQSPLVKCATGSLLPPLTELRQSTLTIAAAVARQAAKEGLTAKLPDAELRKRLKENQWFPHYGKFV